MNITPLFDHVVVRPHKEISSKGGILIPRDADNYHEDIGTVVACGPGDHDHKGQFVPMQVKPGDLVLFSTHGHQVTKVDGEELIVFRQNSIIGKLGE